MPSSETSRRLKRDRSAQVSGKILGLSGERKGGIYRFWGAELHFGRPFGEEVGPFGSPFFDFGTDLLVLLQLKQLRGGR
jgi:hypothetical protein